MKIGSLCTGIGGLDLAVEYMFNGTLAWISEVDDDAAGVTLSHYDVPNYGDLTEVPPFEPVDVLTAGYPCQPFALAGLRQGSNDERHLWPYIKQIVNNVRPKFIVLENVRGHLTLGFDQVINDLAALGYDASWCCVPVEFAGGPHKRDRLFVLAWPAHLKGNGHSAGLHLGTQTEGTESVSRRYPFSPTRDPVSAPGLTQETPYDARIHHWERCTRPAPDPAAARPNGSPGLNPFFAEWMMGYPQGWVAGHVSTGKALRMLGNAVCPQAAEVALGVLLPRAIAYIQQTP